MLYEGALLAIVVVWFFLRDWRATLLSAVALPLSVIPTFLVMYFAGFSLNTVTLLSLSLVVGILVDDAIVEIENIARHLRMGKPPLQAALEAADEIGLAVIATTLTLVAVFLPTAFMGGIPGLIFRQFGITAAVAVLASLVVARLLTPMMAAYFMKLQTSKAEDGRIMVAYMSLVSACLLHRRLTVIGVLLFLGLSLLTIPLISSGFMPPSDDAQTQVTLTLQPGSTIEQTEAITRRAVDVIARLPEVTHIFSSVGSASSGDLLGSSTTTNTATASMIVSLQEIGERGRRQDEIESEIRQALSVLAGVRIQVGTGGSGTTLAITLASDDPDALNRTAGALEEQLRTLGGIGAVTSSASLQAPEIQIVPDIDRAAALGVTSEAISDAVRVATKLATILLRWRSSTCRSVSLPSVCASTRAAGRRWRISPISRSPVQGAVWTWGRSPTSASVAALPRSVASIVCATSRFQSSSMGAHIGDVYSEVKQLPALQNLPDGVKLVEQGDLQRSSELFESFAVTMGIGVFLRLRSPSPAFLRFSPARHDPHGAPAIARWRLVAARTDQH